MSATTLVLLGKTGNGKSSTGNSILGSNAFKSHRSSKSVTKECKMESRQWNNKRTLNVIDTPGLFDTNVSKETTEREIVKCINIAKDGMHGILYVLSLRNRFTDEEADATDRIEMLFGPTIVNYMVIIFTGGDELENDGATLEDCMGDFSIKLKRIIKRCNSRMVVFNNHKSASPTVKGKQITELLEHVDCIVAENGNQPYSNELFDKAQMMSSQLYHIKDKEKIYATQIEKLKEMMETNTRAMEERMRSAITDLNNQLESARRSRDAAVSESLLAKSKLEATIRDLEKQVKELKNEQDSCKPLKEEEKDSCKIL